MITLAVLLFYMFDLKSKGQLCKYSEDNVAIKFSKQYDALLLYALYLSFFVNHKRFSF